MLWTVAGVLLLTVAVLLGYRQFFRQNQIIVEYAALNSQCRLTEFPCTVRLMSGGRVQLNISPQPVEVMKPLEVRVALENIKARSVIVQFNGVGMNMGVNRYIFNQEQDGSYRAQVTLPICIRNRMEWMAEVYLETGQGTIVFPYRFVSIKG